MVQPKLAMHLCILEKQIINNEISTPKIYNSAQSKPQIYKNDESLTHSLTH